MQNEITADANLFSPDGSVEAVGWSKQPYLNYDKDYCKIPSIKLSERDCYYIHNDEMGLYLAVAVYGMTAQITATLINFDDGIINTSTVVKRFATGSVKMPLSSKNGDVTYADNRIGINFANTAVKRYLKVDFINFADGKNLYVNVAISDKNKPSINSSVNFGEKHKRNFFIKRFMPSMSVSGVIRCGGAEYNLSDENSCAYLDWSRYCTPDKTFYSALYADGFIGDKRFAICITSGLTDNYSDIENCFFYDGSMYKISAVKMEGSEEHLDRIWKFECSQIGLKLIFEPTVVESKCMSVDCDRRSMVFGTISGIIELGTVPIEIFEVPAHMEFTITGNKNL